MGTDDDSGKLNNSLFSMQTSLSLLIQRAEYLELDIKRLGDKMRSLEDTVRNVERSYNETYTSRGEAIERVEKGQETVSNRFWALLLSVIGAMIVFLIQERFRK